MPAVLNPLAPAYHFGPVKSTPDGPEAMVPAKSCDVNTGRNQAMSAPTRKQGFLDRGVTSPTRGLPSVNTGHRPQNVDRDQDRASKTDRSEEISSRGSDSASCTKKGGVSVTEQMISSKSGASPCKKKYFDQPEKIVDSSKSGVSPCDFFLGPASPKEPPTVLKKSGPIDDNQQLDCAPQREPTKEETLWFARALEALGE